MTLDWERQPIDGSIFKDFRRQVRIHHRQKGRGGHEFIRDDVRSLWSSGDSHLIISHNIDRFWQFWWRHPEAGWFLQSWHRVLSEAKEEAENPRVFELPKGKKRNQGSYLCAEWPDSFCDSSPMMVRCSSQYTTSEMRDVFEGLGCQTYTKVVV
jgi:hypothetical protein